MCSKDAKMFYHTLCGLVRNWFPWRAIVKSCAYDIKPIVRE